MKRWITKRALRLALVTTALLAVAAGVAYATIPDSGKLFHACMLNNIGTVRLIDPSLASTNPMSHCASLETQVTWNQVGQQGPQGLQGPKGDPGKDGANGTNGADGAPGPAGPAGRAGSSDLYVSQPASADCCPPLTKDYATVAQVNLPPGKYLVTANTSFQNFEGEPNPINALCYVEAPIGGNVGSGMTSVLGVPYTLGSLSLLAPVAMNVNGTVSMRCEATVGLSNQSPAHFIAQFITLSAVKAEEIH